MGRPLFAFVAVVGMSLFLTPCFAQTPEPPGKPDDSTMQEFIQLERRLTELFGQKEYEKAADLCRKQMELMPKSDEPHYNLACAYSRLGQKEEALKELAAAVKLGFIDAAHLKEDEDLASLHGEQKFKEIAKEARDHQLAAPHEKAIDMPGVKTVEGFPEKGLRYRLRISPDATREKPARLIIWLHPSGGSMDEQVEKLSIHFIRDGYALLVLTQKNYNFWSEPDAKALLEETLPEVAKTEGLDANKPILMGFSAGGQMALQMWYQNPGAYGGLVLDAAYPLDSDKYAHGQIDTLPLPINQGIKTCPIFAIVGGADGGSRLWQTVEEPWRKASVPLTIHIIPGEGHAWLFSASQIAFLNDWLKDVAAGKRPNGENDPPANRRPLPGDSEGPLKI